MTPQLERPYWAVLSATVVLHTGGDRASTTVRGVHCIAGSLLGIGVAAGGEGISDVYPTGHLQKKRPSSE
ncbi:FUSC family protein [Streptomyces sp. NPDC004685]